VQEKQLQELVRHDEPLLQWVPSGARVSVRGFLSSTGMLFGGNLIPVLRYSTGASQEEVNASFGFGIIPKLAFDVLPGIEIAQRFWNVIHLTLLGAKA
jgi:hypothetical protein